MTAVLGGLGTFAAWIVVMALNPSTLAVGLGWMVFGILVYVLYRRNQGLPLTETVKVVTPEPLGVEEIEYRSVLVAFEHDEPFSEEMAATAVKLASKRRRGIHIHSMLVVPTNLPLDADLPEAEAEAQSKIEQAKLIGGQRVTGHVDRVRPGQEGYAISDEAKMINAAAVVVGLRYRNGKPLYDKTLQTVLGERPCRVIVVSDRSVHQGAEAAPCRPSSSRPERGLESPRAFSRADLPRLDPRLLDRLHRPRRGHPRDHPGRRRRAALGRHPARRDLRRDRRRPALDSDPDRTVSDDGAQPEQAARARQRPPQPKPLIERGLGVPGLFVAVYSAVGFSIYFALGVVADRGLGLTPLIFLAAGLLFVLTTLSYVEGGAMIRERGGSSSFARHAFNELVAFIAGWAILIDYLIVAALAAISVPHYLEPISADLCRARLGDRHRGPGDRRRLRPQRAQHHRPRPRAPASRSSPSPTSPCSWR